MVSNRFLDFTSEKDFWESSIEECSLLIVDRRFLEEEMTEWIKKIQRNKPRFEHRIIWVVETKEERERMMALGIQNVLRLPFQWNQWLPVIRKMGLRWRLWGEETIFRG